MIIPACLRRTCLALMTGLVACTSPTPEPTPAPSPVAHPPRTADRTIYEVNVRQFSPAGTFKGVESELPRLKQLGVGILWLMPIFPIGVEQRKGGLGSPYAVKDYQAVNPEFGTMADLKSLVSAAHANGMLVILDWVANHTAPDNALVAEHPDWYTRDAAGKLVPPVPDWSDVVDLNYDKPELRAYMTNAMAFWLREADVDGFRCDVAEMVPLDFWQTARTQLDAIKPVFMLAEGEKPELHERAFDMTYGWTLFTLMKQIAKGEATASQLGPYFARQDSLYPDSAYRMLFTTNHDENSWNGTTQELFGDGARAFAVLAATAPGMPLIYNGQEAGLDRRLAFFERDPIDWKDSPNAAFYERLTGLKRDHPALFSGDKGGPLVPIPTGQTDVFAFSRQRDSDTVVVVLNLSSSPKPVTLASEAVRGPYADALTGQSVTLDPKPTLKLDPWGALVYVRP